MTKIVTMIPGTSYNNDNIVFEDETHESKRMQEILGRASSTALDPQAVKMAKIKSDFSHYCLIPLYDLHMFGEGFNMERFKMVTNYLMQVSNAYTFIGGDWYDNANVGSKSNPYNSKTNISQAIDGSEYLLEQIKSKILFVLGGNHDGEFGDRVKPSNISPAKESAKKIAKYVPYHALINIKLGDNFSFNLFATHGSMAKTVDELRTKCMKVSSTKGIIPDIIMSGHVHTNMSFIVREKVPVKDKNGMVIEYKEKNIRVEILPSFQGDNEYSVSKGFNDGFTNAYAYDFSYEKNPFYNSTTKNNEFEYMLKVTKFALLKKHSNEYTSFAKKYMEAYKEPDMQSVYEAIQEELKKDKFQKSIQEISHNLNEIGREI